MAATTQMLAKTKTTLLRERQDDAGASLDLSGNFFLRVFTPSHQP
jgi:hypothetical protein